MKQIITFLTFWVPFSLLSQINETFSGPEISSENLWQGNTQEFFINPQNELEFNSPKNENGETSIYLTIPYSSRMIWEMESRMDFKPTNSNNTRVYVYHSLKEKTESYYIQIGNNTGQISLYRQGDSNPVLCIAGRKSLLENPDTHVFVRLTLEKNEEWTLYSRTRQEKEYIKEGEYKRTISTPLKEGEFRITCRYVKSRISNFCFDNISVFSDPNPPEEEEEEEETPPPPPPTPLPELTGMKINMPSGMELLYDKEVAITEASIEITGIGKAESIRYGKDRQTLLIEFPFIWEPGEKYALKINGLYSTEGQKLPEEFWDFEIEKEELPEPPETPEPEIPEPPNPEPPPVIEYSPGTVIINEVMADPKGLTAFPETEYIELYNTTKETVFLENWIFYYGTQKVILPDKQLPANSYAVLYRHGREIHIDEKGLGFPLSKFPAALANTGKELSLEDAAGNRMDHITYSKATPGKAWERMNDKWYLSTDDRGGTPGSINSTPEGSGDTEKPEIPDTAGSIPEPAEIIFNELLPNPFPEGSEFIEFYNRSEKNLSLSGLSLAVRKTDGTFATHYPFSTIPFNLPPGGYLVVTKEKDGILSFYPVPDEARIQEIKIPVLSNTSSTLVLFRTADLTVIDEISYSSKWHSTSLLSQKGVSLERIDINGATQDETNWNSASAMAGYATPGSQNSQQVEKGKESKIELGKPVYHQDGTYSIPYQLDNAGYHCRTFLYTLSGKRMADIANHLLTGTSGSLSWNGIDNNNKKTTTGIYILYVEFYHPEGKTKQFKIPFPVR